MADPELDFDPSRPPPLPSVDPDRLLDVMTVPVPSGPIQPAADRYHVLDIHLGHAVQTTCSIDSRERRGLQTHGSFCVVPAGITGRWLFARPAGALLIRLTPALFRETAAAVGITSGDAELVPSIHRNDPYIERIGWMLQAAHDDGYPDGRLLTDSLAAALAARLLGLQSRQAASAAPSRRGLPTWRLRNVLDYIEANLDQDLGLTELAAVAGFSLSHFKPMFKQAVGVPVHRYVLERRVERARILLLEGKKRTADIALEAGFTHQSHMARCMRRVLGVSPSQLVRPTAASPRRR